MNGHYGNESLRAFLDGRLAAHESESLLLHLDVCEACARRLDELEPVLSEYGAFRGRELPSRPWAPLHAPPHTGWPPVRWTVLAAALAAGVILSVAVQELWRHDTGGQSLASLLAEARTRNSRPPRTARLRVETGQGVFLRPAVLYVSMDAREAALRTRFAAARYDWTDPLNLESYARWRDSLGEKKDAVSRAGDTGPYTVSTSTDESELAEASLTIDAQNLTPDAGRFVFRDREWVEISVVPPAESDIVPANPSPPPAKPLAAEPSVEQRRLQVRLALDKVLFGQGAPVTVETDDDGRIIVSGYNLSRAQSAQLELELSTVPRVLLRSVGAPQEARPVAANTEIDHSQAILTEAHFLRELDEQFPPAAAARLGAGEREQLRDLQRRHLERMAGLVDNLSMLLASVGEAAVVEALPQAPAANDFVDRATNLDRLITEAYSATRLRPPDRQVLVELGWLRRASTDTLNTLRNSGPIQ